MSINVINPNKGRVYFSRDGLVLDSANLDKYHPNSNVNTLQVNIEDGGMLNSMALINYQSPNMAMQSQSVTSHWYPLFFIGINNVKVANEGGKRTFAQFLTPIPVNILNLNLGRSLPMNVKATVKLVGGVNFKGVFDSLGELQAQIPPTLALDEEYAIACVIDVDGNVDYYQVDETSTNVYEWVKNSETTNPILSLLESKQYNISNISVQGGFGNATPLPLATQHSQILWQAINNQGNAISDLDNKVDNVLSFYQNLIQSVLETNTIKPTITNDFPNGKRLELDVKVSADNDLIEVETDGIKVTNAKVDERIDLKTNPIIQDIDDMINGDKKFNVVGYNVAYSGTLEIGETAWNDTFKCLETRVSDNVVIQHGQEQLQYVRASTNILNGQAVYVSGSTGQRLTVGVANNNIKAQAQSTIAVATENFTLVGADQFGFVCSYGLVNGIKTDYATWVTGQPLYLGINGVLTNVIPSGTAYIVRVGIVGRVHGVDGSIMVAPMYMPTMGELSQVDDVTPQIDDIFIRNASGVMVNSQRFKTTETKVVSLENANMFKDVNYNNVNGVLTFTKYDDTTKEIDLPLELIVTSGYYDEVTNELVLVLANGSEIRIPVGDLLTDLDAHNIRFNGSGTNYLVNKLDVESAVKELDTRVKGANDTVALKVNTSDIVDNLTSTDTNKPLSANQGKVLNDTKANVIQEDWITPTLLNGWVSNVPDSTAPAGYYKNSIGQINLKGRLSNGTNNATVFNLPVGYRPPYNVRFTGATRSQNEYWTIEVRSNGDVVILKNSETVDRYVDLICVTFRAEA